MKLSQKLWQETENTVLIGDVIVEIEQLEQERDKQELLAAFYLEGVTKSANELDIWKKACERMCKDLDITDFDFWLKQAREEEYNISPWGCKIHTSDLVKCSCGEDTRNETQPLSID